MSKEHAYAYEAGYRDGSIHYELEHCPACKNVADLQEALAENVKLRELVRDLWKACPADGYYCIYHCEHYDKESESHCKLEDRMRELGVGVDA